MAVPAETTPRPRPGRRARDLSLYQSVVLVAPPGRCPLCGKEKTIQQHRERPFQTLSTGWWTVLKDRRCSDRKCPGRADIGRPVEEVSFRGIRRCSYGLDVLDLIGQRRQRDARSFPEIHTELEKRGVIISQRHVNNLFRLYLAVIHCQSLEDDAVRRRLRDQGRVLVAADAVRLDDVSAPLYVVWDLLSGEPLLAERVPSPTEDALVKLLGPLLELGVPVEGVVVDKESALVKAFQKVLPGAPLQFCQTHYLKNLVKPMESELATLAKGVKDAVQSVREVKKTLDASPGKFSQAERELADVLCRGVDAMGKSHAGDKLFEPPALKRHERLTELAEATQDTLRRKGGAWPLLTRILTALSLLTQYGELARRLKRQFQVVRDIANILGLAGTGSEIEGLLNAFLEDLVAEAPRRGRGAAFGHFVAHVLSISDRFWVGLFHCYDVPGLPRNNNDLERFFNALKRHARRVHGRKSTAGGPLESFAPFLLQVWSRIDEYPSLERWLHELPPEKLQQAREELENCCRPARRRRSFLRTPRRQLDRALERFLQH